MNLDETIKRCEGIVKRECNNSFGKDYNELTGFLKELKVYREQSKDKLIIEALSKQVPFQLKNKDKETLTGICKCGRVTAKVDGEFYCKYCGQRVFY